MAFLDDIGKAFSNAGQKTKDMADIAKFNSLLSEEEKKINNLYTQIGKTYVQLHPTDYDENLAAFFMAYRESEKKIAEIKARLKQLKNLIDCPGCGSELPADAMFCSKCGYRMPTRPVVVPDGSAICTSCGAFVPKTMRFCTGCGAPMAVSQSIPVTSMPTSAPAYPAASTPAVAPVAPVVPPVNNSAPITTPVAPLPEPDPIVLPEPTEPPLDLFAPLSDHALPDAPEADSAPAAEPVPAAEPTPKGNTCSNCGADLEPDCAFCVVCGSPVAAAPVSADKCPSCGATLDGDSLFCIECGSKVK